MAALKSYKYWNATRLEAVGVEAYLQQALETDQPLLIAEPEQTPRLEVLDQRLDF